MLLVQPGQVARSASAKPGKEKEDHHYGQGEDHHEGVHVDVGIVGFDAFEHVWGAVAVVVHVLGQPARVPLGAVQNIGLSVPIRVDLSTRVERERIPLIAESVVVVVLVVDVWPAGLARVRVEPCVRRTGRGPIVVRVEKSVLCLLYTSPSPRD